MSTPSGQDIVFGPESAALRTSARRHRALQGGTLFFVAVALSQAFVYQRAGGDRIAAAFVVCAALGVGNAVLVWRGGDLRAATWRGLAILWLAISYAVLYGGGYHAATFFWLYLVPFAAGTVLGLRGGWIWIGVLAAQTIAFWALDAWGLTPVSLVPGDGVRVLVNRLAALLAIGAMLQIYVQDQRRKDLDLARAFQDLEQQRGEIRRLAYLDPLTGLANRRRFVELMGRAIEGAQRRGQGLALFFVDLDRFKPINDEFGHAAGDLVIAEAARRIQDTVRAGDLVGRVGPESFVSRIAGDEFTVLLAPMESLHDAERVAERIVRVLDKPVEFDGQSVAIAASIGIALLPEHGDSTEVLLRAADTAMYAAKRDGGGWRVAAPLVRAAS